MKTGAIPMLIGAALVLWVAGYAVGRHAAPVEELGTATASEMERAMAEVLEEPNALARTSGLVDLLRRLGPDNISGAAAAVDKYVNAADEHDVKLFLSAWVAFDPQGAFEHVLTWKLPSKRRLGLGQVMYAWAAGGHGLEAKQYLDGVVEWKTHDSAFGGLVRGWVRSGDLEGVTNVVSRLPHSDGRDNLVAMMVEGILLDHGIDGLVQWADEVPVDANDKFKRIAFRKAIRQVSNRDPARAARWYEEHAHEEYAELVPIVVASEWAEHDPEAAIAWIRSQPARRERDVAMGRLMRRWVARDPGSATAWMEGTEISPDLVPLVPAYARGIAVTDPAAAAVWVARIQDERQAGEARLVVADAWKRSDPVAAEAWLSALDVSEEERRRLERAGRSNPEARRLAVPKAELQ